MTMERWRPWAPRVWRPFREMEEMERWMDEVFRRFTPSIWWRVPAGEVAWMPALEMYEKPNKFVVRAELPGMKKEEIDIHIVGDSLTITGERKTTAEVKDEEYQRCEFCYGKFSRSITLPATINAAKVDATYENGILEISLPKAEEVKPKKIQIKAGGAQTKAEQTEAKPKSK